MMYDSSSILYIVYTDISDGYSYSSDVDDVMLDNNCYVAAVSYTKQAQDELSVHEGQVVCVVDDSDKSKLKHLY